MTIMNSASRTDEAELRGQEAEGYVSSRRPDRTPVDPMLFGAPALAIGAIALALFVAGLGASNNLAGVMPIMVCGSGAGLITAAIVAIRRGDGPMAVVFGTFGAFWLSLVGLQIGLVNAWYGQLDMPLQFDSTASFLLTWFIALIVLTVASLRMPSLVLALFVLIDLSLLANFASVAAGSQIAYVIGIVALFGLGLLGVYLFYGAMRAATGGRPSSLGTPLLKR